MSRPLELCLEDLAISEEEDRYVRCVALAGPNPRGLALDRAGLIRWMPEDDDACFGLWVSADDRLVLLRGRGAPPIAVVRGGRRVDAPEEKPVILLDQDRLLAGGRELRVHFHGGARELHPPLPVRGSALRGLVRAAAAALAIGAVAGAADARPAGTPAPIEVREQPPSEAAPVQIECTVTAMKPGKVLTVEATCPKSGGIGVGTTGQLLDPKTKAPIANGGVRVTAVKGTAITAEAAQLKKAVNAKILRLTVY